MKQKYLSGWIKGILTVMGVCGAVMYLFVLPLFGREMQEMYPEYACAYLPWLIFLWLSGIPCFMTLFYGWRIASNIGKDQSFSMQNAVLLKRIAVLAAADALFFFLGNLVFAVINWSSPGIMLMSLGVDFAGVAVSIAAAVLSHLVQKAAALQEQSDLTI
ncbi:MAG: DUF2975 domain-containing protein [Clostridia bacterium]|nr:DUF2975 domain-containing protein [Clostridia bacterium]MBR6524662.1 DUF2975 domain-containing protein [Clostridia bacterium]